MPSCLSLEIKRPSCAPSKRRRNERKLSLISVSSIKVSCRAFLELNLIFGVSCLVKTDKLADKHYQRVSHFAKEMLVNPRELDVHKLKNDFSEDIRDNPVRVTQPNTIKNNIQIGLKKHP